MKVYLPVVQWLYICDGWVGVEILRCEYRNSTPTSTQESITTKDKLNRAGAYYVGCERWQKRIS